MKEVQCMKRKLSSVLLVCLALTMVFALSIGVLADEGESQPKVTVSVTPGTLHVSETAKLTYSTPENATNVQVDITKGDDVISISLEGDTVTALKAGTAEIKVTADIPNPDYVPVEPGEEEKPDEEEKPGEGTEGTDDTQPTTGDTSLTEPDGEQDEDNEEVPETLTIEGTASVTVEGMTVSCESMSIPTGSSGELKDPEASGYASGLTVIYEYAVGKGGSANITLSGKKVTAGNQCGYAVVDVTAKAVDSANNVKETATTKAYIGVYDDSHTIVAEVSASAGKEIKFNDDDAFSFLSYDGQDLTGHSMNYVISEANDYSHIRYGTLTSLGTLGKEYMNGATATLELNGNTGTESFSYTMVYYYETGKFVKVGGGTIELTVGTATGDIVYKTTTGKSVSFVSSDFTKFWNQNNDVKGTMSYVKFNVSSTVPAYGRLLAKDQSSSKTYDVYNTMQFYTTVPSSNSNYYDLDEVTYSPDSSKTGSYSLLIPFTIYGSTGDELNGTVRIDVNSATNEITSRGISFKGDIAKLITDEFYQKTNSTLTYLTFTIPSASEGKLFYNYSTALNSMTVTKSDKIYTDPTSSQMDLQKISFVPRAGKYGEISIQYTGYSKSGVSYTGTITFNVTEKTKSAVFSDVTASSYSWAADSVDFLYYEEVANGSNGKYNPKSNITRGDFMLMLYRAFLEEKYGNYNVTTNFPDVVKGTTSYSKETYQAVGVAKYLGIAQGSNGKYNPTAYITREEAMTLIYRTLDEVGYSMSYTVSTSTSSFSDYSSVSSYAQAAIKDLIGHGVVIGTNGKIQPKSNITRAEMAVILHRVLTY